MNTFLKSISLTNYRSCKHTDFPINSNLSTLIGANGSGKSNILNGILLLRKIAVTRRDLPDNEHNQSSSKLKATFSINEKDITIDMLVKYTTNDRNIDNVTSTNIKWNFKNINGKDAWVKLPIVRLAEIRNILTVYEKEFYSKSFLKMFLRSIQVTTTKKNEWLLEKDALLNLIPTMEKVSGCMTNIRYYSASQFTDPSRCPTFLEIENGRISSRANVTGNRHMRFMYDLYNAKQNNSQKYQEFLSIISDEGIGLIESIEHDEIRVPSEVIQVAIGGKIIRKETEKILVIPRFNIRGFKLSPNQLSEGTFKTLAIIFYLITDTSQMFILEEPEVCIHQGLLSSILEIIKQLSETKQIIISTHSDFVLDNMTPENVYIVKNNKQKGTTVKRVPSSMSVREYKALKEYLKTSGNLGEFWRHGELEQ